jgi:hypothetical protein
MTVTEQGSSRQERCGDERFYLPHPAAKKARSAELWRIFSNYSQKDATFTDLFIFTNALHVSGGSSAHHQEHITVHTASVIVNQ